MSNPSDSQYRTKELLDEVNAAFVPSVNDRRYHINLSLPEHLVVIERERLAELEDLQSKYRKMEELIDLLINRGPR